jgi:electron transport complex protein RnfD
MFRVIYALIPALLAAVYLFRGRAFLLVFVCVAGCVLAEAAIQRLRKKPFTLDDGSSILTGLLLAFCLPPSIKWYAALLGALFAIGVVKHVFGGLGYNIFNPALGGRAFIAAAYPAMINRWTEPFSLAAVSTATPLALRKFDGVSLPVNDLFWGNVPGCLGETSAVLLILGGGYLLVRQIADWRIPLSMLVATVIVSSLFYLIDPLNGSPLFHLFSGGLMLGTFFMATDPVTTPLTKKGRFLFGSGCGILIMVIRYFGGLPEGVMYAILFMNALVPLINRYTRPAGFGR